MDINALENKVLDDFYYVVGRFYDNSDDQAFEIIKLAKYKLKKGHFAIEFVQKLSNKQLAWK